MMPGCQHRDDAGAWVLGALDDREAATFRAHLESCADCRDEVAHLQPVADTLLLVAPQKVAPPALQSRIMQTVRAEAELLAAAGPDADRPPAPARESRRRRWSLSLRPALAGALAAGLVAVGIGAGLATRSDEPGGVARVVPAEVQLPDAFRADASVEIKSDGDARLRVSRLPAPPEGRVYQVWVLREGEEAPRPTDALFQPAVDGHATVDVPGGVRGVAAVLVTDEPDGGSEAPTREPTIVAPLV